MIAHKNTKIFAVTKYKIATHVKINKSSQNTKTKLNPSAM